MTAQVLLERLLYVHVSECVCVVKSMCNMLHFVSENIWLFIMS